MPFLLKFYNNFQQGAVFPMSVEYSPPPVVQRPAPAVHRRSFGSFRTIIALILREMSTRYGRSPGGYIWAVVEPMGAILLLSAAFSLVIRTPSLGNNFILFYASGYMTFTMYQQLSVTIARSIMFSRPLLFYPAVSWADAVLARLILNGLTGVMVSTIVFAVIFAFLETRTIIDIGTILLSLSLALLMGAGIGAMNCALLGLYPIWDLVWSIATRPLFLASGIFFIYEDMPRSIQDILWYNPLIHISGVMRMGIYPTYKPDYISLPFVLFFGLATLTLGLLLLHRHHKTILEN